MKKIFTLALALILALSMLTACGGDSNDNGGGNNAGGAFEFGQDYINNNLKGDYWIIYNVTTYGDGETDSVTMEQIQTADGYYWSTDGDDGTLFIKNGDSYDVYVKSDDVYENTGATYTKDMVDLMMYSINMYMTTYAAYGDSLKKTGSETIAGRNCEKYAFDFTYPVYNYKFKYTYCIDKETGVCLKFNMTVEGAGEKMGYEFECAKFQTSGVSLPDYK